MTVNEMKKAAYLMRRKELDITFNMGNVGAHIGGGLSLVEIMAVLYLDVLKLDVENLMDEKRDRLIFSKGHGTLGLYTAMWQAGILSEENLNEYKKNEGSVSAHPSKNSDMGIEFSSGSLGQGLSLGVGTCLALKRKGNSESKTYVILGDGECDEGSIWEAAASASAFGLDNLVAIVDKNQLQYDGTTDEILNMGPLEEKWKSFGWDVVICDGHNIEELQKALHTKHDKPFVLIANTVKGKGVSFMEGNPLWHNGRLSEKQYNQAIEEVDAAWQN